MTSRSNYKTKGFTFNSPSLTVPGQVLSIKTIAERFRRGQGIQSYTPSYNPDIPPGIENLNKLERIDALRYAAKNVQNIRENLQNAAKTQKQDEAEKKYLADVEKMAKKLSETKNVSEP